MNTKDKTPENQRSNPATLIAMLLVFGVVLGGIGLYKYNAGKESAGWPAVKGTITYSHAAPRKVKTGHHYQPSVKYTYTVKRRPYSGSRISSSDVYQKTLPGAEEILKKYPVGTEVSVYYDPAAPGNSLLETGIKKNVYVLFAGAGFCLFCAGAIIVSALKKKNAPPPLG